MTDRTFLELSKLIERTLGRIRSLGNFAVFYLNLVYDGDTASPDEAGNGLRHEHLQQYLGPIVSTQLRNFVM